MSFLSNICDKINKILSPKIFCPHNFKFFSIADMCKSLFIGLSVLVQDFDVIEVIWYKAQKEMQIWESPDNLKY